MKNVQKLIAYIISQALFGTGSLISSTWNTKLNQRGMGYGLYNWLMIKSMKVQDWAGNKTPWTEVE